MSSLTDIIFLLLIFFMLTSSLTTIKPFDLPISDSQTVASTTIVVTLERDGNTTLNNKQISRAALEPALRTAVAEAGDREQTTVTIVAETGTAFDEVTKVMKIAGRLGTRAIIATQPNKGAK